MLFSFAAIVIIISVINVVGVVVVGRANALCCETKSC
jgi:hypothetical protein